MDPLAPTQADLDSYTDLMSRMSTDGISAITAARLDHNSNQPSQIDSNEAYLFFIMTSAVLSYISHFLVPPGGL